VKYCFGCAVIACSLVMWLGCAKAQDRLLIVGDSQVGGYGEPLARLLGQHGTAATVEFHNGWSVRDFVRHQLPGGYPTVVVGLGGNNTIVHEAQYGPMLYRFVRRLRQKGARRIVWFGSPRATNEEQIPLREHTRRMQQRVLPTYGVTWVDTADLSSDLRRRRDGVHFFQGEYRRFARRLYERLRSMLW